MLKQARKQINDSALPSSVCSFCANLLSTNKRKCLAFDSIPDKIWSGVNDHTSPVDGDDGILFESVSDEDDGDEDDDEEEIDADDVKDFVVSHTKA